MKPFKPYELPIDDHINPMEFYNELINASTNVGKYQVIEFIGRKPDGLALWMNADICNAIQY